MPYFQVPLNLRSTLLGAAFPLLLLACSEPIDIDYSKLAEPSNGADGADGTDGADGKDGTACVVLAEGDGGAYGVYCDGLLVGYLNSGEQGSSGSQGVAGADGSGCWKIESQEGNYYEIWCGTPSSSSKAAEIPKAVCGKTAYDPATQFCDIENFYAIDLLCNEQTFNTAAQFCDNNQIIPLCNGQSYATATHFCDEENIIPLCGGLSYTITEEYCNEGNVITALCRDPYNPLTHYCATKGNGDTIGANALLFDERDGKIYKTIQIGEQIWMAQNLNYAVVGTCVGGEDNCNAYGRRYNWREVMNGSSATSNNPSGVLGICPSGWHVPSESEFKVLLDAPAVGGINGAGGTLKTTSGWNVASDGTTYNGTDEFGFSALPAPFAYSSYNYLGQLAVWWTTTARVTNSPRPVRFNQQFNGYDVPEPYWSGGFSLRCVKNL